MQLGINHPWHNNGWDFGPTPQLLSPPAGGTQATTWRDEFQTGPDGTPRTRLDGHLASYRGVGISAVRWFILADGYNLGTPTYSAGKGWQYTPPKVDGTFLSHFGQMIQGFQRARMLFLPSFISFEFLGPGRVYLNGREVTVGGSGANVEEFVLRHAQRALHAPVDPRTTADYRQFIKGGRGSVLADATSRQDFLEACLEPLLKVAGQGARSDVIMAFELINEPELAVQKGITQTAMDEFLFEGIRRITQTGLPATVGFQTRKGLQAFLDHKSYGPVIRQLIKSGAFIPQHHYYPEKDGQGALSRAPENCILGEFAIAGGSAGLLWEWAKERPEETDATRLANRLKQARSYGYPWAFPWSAHHPDCYFRWDETILDAIQQFTSGR